MFDDDDVAIPNALERFVRPLESHPEYGFSFISFYFTTSNSKTNRLSEVCSKQGIPDLNSRGFMVPLLESNFLGGVALFARTHCYQKVGGFNPALLRSQDYEMAIRIFSEFKGIQVEGGPTFHYRQHQGS